MSPDALPASITPGQRINAYPERLSQHYLKLSRVVLIANIGGRLAPERTFVQVAAKVRFPEGFSMRATA